MGNRPQVQQRPHIKSELLLSLYPEHIQHKIMMEVGKNTKKPSEELLRKRRKRKHHRRRHSVRKKSRQRHMSK